MKKKFRMLICCMLIAIMETMSVQAAEQNSYYGVPVDTTGIESNQYLQEGDAAIARILGIQERGSVIDTAIARISNLGGGDIGVLLTTTAHVECSEIRNLAIIERLNGETWEEIARYEFTASKEDFPTEDLSGMTNEFTVKNQETDRYYRVRGIHCVWAAEDGEVAGIYYIDTWPLGYGI